MTTKRIAVIADSHFDETSRFDECISIHDWIAEDIASRGADLIVHTGDVLERKSTPTERVAVANWLTRVAEIAPTILVRGNHDWIGPDGDGDLAIFSKLRTRHAIIVEERAGVHIINGIAVAAMAWPRKAQLLAASGLSAEAAEQTAAAALRSVLRGLGAELAMHDGPRMLAVHAMVRGSVTSTGQPLCGCDMEIGVEDLALANPQFVALGHIHCGQNFNFGGIPMVFPGSPRRTAFGEVEEKAYLEVLLSKESVEWKRIPTPATPMLLVEDEWHDGAWRSGAHRVDPKGAELRFRFRVASDQRDAAKAAAASIKERWLAAGAIHVKLDEQVVPTVRARAPEITTATKLTDKLACLWRVRRDAPDEARRERLFSKLTELEEAS